MRELEDGADERLATVPDFFVEEVRLEAAAARLGVALDALRDLEAVLPGRRLHRAAAGAAGCGLLGRGADAPDVPSDDRGEQTSRAPRERSRLRGGLLGSGLLGRRLLGSRLLRAGFLAVRLLGAGLRRRLCRGLLGGRSSWQWSSWQRSSWRRTLARTSRPTWRSDFAAVFLECRSSWRRLFEPVFLALDEPLRELLFFAVFLVLVAPVSPVNSIVSGFDLSSVGIAASFKGLRVQPSRLQGNVVIPRGFRITESVESRTRTFSVDMSTNTTLFTCGCKTQYRV